MTRALLYVSTRHRSPAIGISDAIGSGLAPDGGLYVPHRLPQLAIEDFNPRGSLADTAHTLLTPFFAGDRLAKSLANICREALDFDTPLCALPQDDAYMLELFHGPTAAFKDIGARFLAACLRRLPRSDKHPLTILVATSGDTGAAVGSALHRQAGIRVLILYPDGLVAARQAHQLGCFGDNVQALRVQGRFDDCQRMVKTALHNHVLQTHCPLSSANSISLGRLLPQMSYYAHTALRYWHNHHMPLGFIVPTGNLGNALAALWVQHMGLPIAEVYLACNSNATLPEFFAGADYRPRQAVTTLANAMDVGAPSNFERLRWTYPNAIEARSRIRALSVDDAHIQSTLTYHARRYDTIICPHTATAMYLLDRLREEGHRAPCAIVATAHPAKFDQIVEPLAQRQVPVPSALSTMLKRSTNAQPLNATQEALEQWLRQTSSDAR